MSQIVEMPRCSAKTVARLGALAFVVAAGLRSAAQDVVTIAASSDPRSQTKLSGRVVDYNGRELRLALPGGSEHSIPAPQVLAIDTQYTADQVRADELFARGQYEQAVAHYRRARTEDQRPWVRRRITAQIVWCEQACGQPVAAGEEFLILVRSDPETPYFACIPLAWLPAQPSPELEQAARGWLGRNELPAATLLGASHLMSTARPQALDCLKQLATSSDSRIAQLAIAQSWRAAVVTAGEDEVAGWERAIERMPEGLRAGPYYVLGSALLRQQRWERAALALMRVPILYPVDQSLAARCLLDAGSALERLGRPQQAVGLYRELTAMHAPPRDQTEARSRLEALGGANERR